MGRGKTTIERDERRWQKMQERKKQQPPDAIKNEFIITQQAEMIREREMHCQHLTQKLNIEIQKNNRLDTYLKHIGNMLGWHGADDGVFTAARLASMIGNMGLPEHRINYVKAINSLINDWVEHGTEDNIAERIYNLVMQEFTKPEEPPF